MSVITVIGAGVMGSAMSFPGRDNNHTIRLAGTPLDREIIEHCARTNYHLNLKRHLPEGVEFFQLEDLDAALKGADIIIGGVSSFGVNWFADEIIPRLPDNIPVLSITKGMLNQPDGSLLSYPAYYAKKSPGKRFNAVGGPCTSYELADRDQTHVCFCGPDMDVLRTLKKALETSYYHISLTTDIEGLECAVALKNAYALAVTLAVGMWKKRGGEIHYNSQAALFGQSVKEMGLLLELFSPGENKNNFIFGAGDLYVTIYGGRTRQVGTLLGEGRSFEEAMETLAGVTLESIVIATRTAQAVRTLIEKKQAKETDFPLLLHVDDLINRGKTVDIPWEAFTIEGCFK